MKKSLYKDERGLGHVVLAVIIVAVIAVVGVVGWRIMQNNKTAKTPEQKAANSACMKVYNDKRLCDFAAANADLGKVAYTAVDNSTDAQGQTTQITIKSDGKGNISISSKSGNQSYNTITIGNTVYVQNGASWIKYTSNAPASTNPASDLKASFSDSSTPADKQIKYKSAGTAKCGNATCYKYQVIDPTTAGTTYIWINTSNNRLQRLTTSSSQGTNDFVISYGPVTITAPSPVSSPASALDPAQQAEMQAAQQAAQQAQQNAPQY